MYEGTPANDGSRLPVQPVRRYCTRCSPGLFRRVNRATLFERTLFTWLGLFPWECVSCRRKRFFRDSGRKVDWPASA